MSAETLPLSPPAPAPALGLPATATPRRLAVAAASGTGLGVALSMLGFGDYGEVHRMFTFADLRLSLAFLGAVALLAVGLRLGARGRPLPRKPLHPGSVPGGMLFGAGWALSGACPAIPLVQLGEGQVTAAVTLLGIVFGVSAWALLNRRLQWDTGSCA